MGIQNQSDIFFKDLYNHYYRQLGSQLNQYVFLPSDPDELVDQSKLLFLKK